MTRRTKSWVAVLLFIAVFGALLVTATFTDLQVSHILTAKALAAHTYYTNETTYGVVLERSARRPSTSCSRSASRFSSGRSCAK